MNLKSLKFKVDYVRKHLTKNPTLGYNNGKTIIITETTRTEKHEVVDGKLVSTPIESTEEVLRLSL